MNPVEIIKEPILKELHDFKEFYKKALTSNYPLLIQMGEYVFKQKGKQMRPILVLLSAKLHGEVNETTFVAASVLELLHNATLVHDDVVDETYERRDMLSVNAIWKSKAAVLYGDYMLSKGLDMAVCTNNMGILRIVAQVGKALSEGELIQLDKSWSLDITEDIYYRIIENKTALLFSSCAEAGAISANATEEKCKKISEFGRLLGMAFQIKDDIFDYLDNVEIGKPTGNDIKEHKMTLPLIHALRNATEAEREEIIDLVKNHDQDTEKIHKVISFTIEKGGLEYAQKIMGDYAQKALAILESYPPSSSQAALYELIHYTMRRNK